MPGFALGNLDPRPKQPVNRRVAAGSNLINVLLGLKDSRGEMGQFARGTNVYNGVSSAPHTGGTVAPMDFNAISKGAIDRRLKGARTKVGQAKGKPVLPGGF